MADSVAKITFGYKNTDFTRQYAFDVADSLVGELKDNALAVNASLAASTDGGMASFFLSDDGHNLDKIVDLRLVTTEEYHIDLNGGE